MDIALGIVDLFAGGGLQRDCLRIADALRAQGRGVTLFAARCDADLQARYDVQRLPLRGVLPGLSPSTLSNHARDAAFGRAFGAAAASARCRVGFNKMPGLDFLYCADPPLDARARPAWQKLLPRYRVRRALEAACFAPPSCTRIFLLTAQAAHDYQALWATPDNRITVLPPSIAPERIQPGLRGTARGAMRQALGLAASQRVALWVGAQPKTKGFDRALTALGAAKGWSLIVVGPEPAAVEALLPPAGDVCSRVRALGFREDIPALMAAADLLLHPARLDTTGQVILEALANGLPVVASAVCGFAEHVGKAQAGIVLPEPLAIADIVRALQDSESDSRLQGWSQAALAYTGSLDIVHGLDRAAETIAAFARPQ